MPSIHKLISILIKKNQNHFWDDTDPKSIEIRQLFFKADRLDIYD